MFTKAITRLPGINYQNGLTTVDFGIPDYQKTILEHANYLAALKRCGLSLVELPVDLNFPDSTFVEDTAILLSGSLPCGPGAILTRPGAESRTGEILEMRKVLNQYFPALAEITSPGCLDGGDICEAGNHFFIGISYRTNEYGAKQLADWLGEKGFSSSFLDIRNTPGILHLKSGISYLGDNRLAIIDSLVGHATFDGFEIVRVEPGEEYAANCIRVNDYVLIAAGFSKFEAALRSLGYKLIVLEMSEFQKMDGGLSCLSLRF
ncbi:MAG: N(G),N(G)-dimethylarginine dimethylaminohydrolase [Chloroflexota bacterium]